MGPVTFQTTTQSFTHVQQNASTSTAFHVLCSLVIFNRSSETKACDNKACVLVTNYCVVVITQHIATGIQSFSYPIVLRCLPCPDIISLNALVWLVRSSSHCDELSISLLHTGTEP